ncbi:MAG: helix-turn-helix transcriptional regulator [Chitinophagaceae bacterium]
MQFLLIDGYRMAKRGFYFTENRLQGKNKMGMFRYKPLNIKYPRGCKPLNMNDQEKFSRMLRLLLLLCGSRKYTMLELSDRLGTSDRTIFRYLNTFESAGLVINRDNGYHLLTEKDPGKSLSRVFHFSEEEAYILCQALEQIEGGTAIQQKLFQKLHTLYDFKALVNSDSDHSLKNIASLREAIKEKKQVLLKKYRSSNSETISDRLVEPFQFLTDYVAVWCYDPDEGANKQFRISRIMEVEVLEHKWKHECRHAVPFTDIFRMSAEKPIAEVHISMSLKAYNLLIEEYPLAKDHISVDSGKYQLTIPVANFNGITRFVLGLPGEIEVLSPENFKKHLKKSWAY